jgi:hypothetical protein
MLNSYFSRRAKAFALVRITFTNVIEGQEKTISEVGCTGFVSYEGKRRD